MNRLKLMSCAILFSCGFQSQAQEFWSGTKNTTSTISRTGITGFGYSRIRNNDQLQATVFEHTNIGGSLYIRSVADATDSGDIVLNDLGGKVGIGTATPSEKLSVNGNIRAREVKVETANWPDYVFEENYRLPSLADLESYIKTNKHLPNIPDQKQVEAEGISLGEMNRKLLEKVEELTLYIIDLKKESDRQKQQIEKLKSGQ